MKKRLAIFLTGLTTASMSAAMPVCAFVAEKDAAVEIKNEGTESVQEAVEMGDADTSASESTASTPESTVSAPEVHEDTVQNEDGSTTTTTSSTVTETTTTPLEPVVTTTPVNEADSDYHTITDEEGNKLEAYEKTTTTAASEISTETVTTTTVTTETSKMTNAVETENVTVENVTEEGTVAPADTETEAAAKEFLEDQNATSDFAIYADKVDESIGHMDGNVAVDTMATGGQVDIMNKDDS